jgi:sugar phosphate isomerase/epimerase
MKTDQLVMHSLTTGQRNLEEALEAYAAAGFRRVELYDRTDWRRSGRHHNAHLPGLLHLLLPRELGLHSLGVAG